MGKHYRDPGDKPRLNRDVDRHVLRTVCERGSLMYCMEMPANLVTGEGSISRFYLSREACVRNITRHNDGRINKVNRGNRRRARLLVYTYAECLECMLTFIDPDFLPHKE